MSLLRSQDGYCPFCPRHSFSYSTKLPYVRTCGSCGLAYLYEEHVMPVCSRCGAGYTSCACHLKLPKVGQVIKVTQKYTGGLTVITEGPVVSKAISPTGNLGAVTLGSHDGSTRGVSIAHTAQMIEDATWEIVLPPEPADRSIWISLEPGGSPAALCRLDIQSKGDAKRWFWPGSNRGITWAEVYAQGDGYLLEAKNG